MKQKLIQLILLERYRCGIFLCKIRDAFKKGEPVPEGYEQSLQCSFATARTALWALRELSPDDFLSTTEILGIKLDEEIQELKRIDDLITDFSNCCGEIASASSAILDGEGK